MNKQDLAYLTAQNLYLYEKAMEERTRQGDGASFRLHFQRYLGALELAAALELISREEARDREAKVYQRYVAVQVERCMREEESSG